MRRARFVPVAGFLVGLLATLLVNYHSYVTDFNLVPGDRGDTRLLVFTLEHWYRVFGGHEAFFQLGMFHPDRLSLAYADGLFLMAIPYAIFRLARIDYFTSYQLLLLGMTILGYSGWFLVLKRALRLQPGLAILGSVLLSCMNVLQFQADNGQLRAVLLYPLLIWLLWRFVEAEQKADWRPTLSLIGFAVGLGLLFFTSFYPAWFFLFSLALFGLAGLASGILQDGPRPVLARIGRFVADTKWQLPAAMAAFALSLIPFFTTYAPLIRSKSSRNLAVVQEFLPRLADLGNVSPNNVVWSPTLRTLGFDFGNREVQTGSPYFVLLLFGITLLVLLWRWRRLGWRRISGRDRLLVLLCVTGALLAALSVKIHGVSLWYGVYTVVPGASALRAVGRILVMIDMIVLIVAMCGLDDLHRTLEGQSRGSRTVLGIGAAILALLLIAEQINTTAFRLDKAQQLADMNRFTPAPAACGAFFINEVATNDLPVGYYQLDAMMLSMQLGIPTVNGYAGIQPDEAFALVPQGTEYKYRILDWLRSQRAAQGICELDYQTAAFQPIDVEAAYQRYAHLYQLSLLEMFAKLHAAASTFLSDGNALADLYPQYLEQHGYLQPELGSGSDARYRWIQDRYWIGERPCNKGHCFAIGVVGSYMEIQPILETFGDQAIRVLFPSPQQWQPDQPIPPGESGELLLIFAADDYRH